MKAYFRSRDNRVRFFFNKFEIRRLKLNFFLTSSFLPLTLKTYIKYVYDRRFQKYLTVLYRHRNACVVTLRGNAVFRYFKISRMRIKNFVTTGSLAGVSKSS